MDKYRFEIGDIVKWSKQNELHQGIIYKKDIDLSERPFYSIVEAGDDQIFHIYEDAIISLIDGTEPSPAILVQVLREEFENKSEYCTHENQVEDPVSENRFCVDCNKNLVIDEVRRRVRRGLT